MASMGHTWSNLRQQEVEYSIDEPIPPMWLPFTPPSSVPAMSTGEALKAPHEDTQWMVASG